MKNETWDAIEGKMVELRILTNANWKNGEYELAVLGERVLRTVGISIAESERVRHVEQTKKSEVIAAGAILIN